jgi:hypothetical protein
MPARRPLHGRSSIGRRLRSAAQAWGFRTLSLRETAWFYSVGLLTAALLIWPPSPATLPPAAPFPAAGPQSRDLSSEVLGELPDLVRSLAEDGTSGEAESFVTNSRRTAPHFSTSRTGRSGRRPVGRATIYDIRSAARLAAGTAAQSLGNEGIDTPLLQGDESVAPAPGPGGSVNRQAGNPRRPS